MDVGPRARATSSASSYRRPGSRICGRAGQRLRAGLHRYLWNCGRPGASSTPLLRPRAKEAREALEKAQARQSRSRRRRESSRPMNGWISRTAPERAVVAAGRDPGAVVSESGSRQAQARGESATHAGGAEQPGDRRAEVGPVAATRPASGAECSAWATTIPQVIEAKANINTLRGRARCGDQARDQRRQRHRHHQSPARVRVARLAGGATNQGAAHEGRARRRCRAVRDMESAQRAYETCWRGSTRPAWRARPPKATSSCWAGLAAGAVVAQGASQHRPVGCRRHCCWPSAPCWLELLDRRVRAFEDVTTAVGLPVLGVMPKPTATFKLGKQRLSLMQQRLVTSCRSTKRVNKMAKFRDSSLHDAAAMRRLPRLRLMHATVHDRSIGAIISETRNLSANRSSRSWRTSAKRASVSARRPSRWVLPARTTCCLRWPSSSTIRMRLKSGARSAPSW
jgi:polysaccharide biosynthesis transport protein